MGRYLGNKVKKLLFVKHVTRMEEMNAVFMEGRE
jgi:hypothetical protein